MGMTHSFEWEGAVFTLSAPTGFTKARQWRLTALAREFEGEDLRYFGGLMALMLAVTVSVEGDLGFPVPNGNATAESFLQFCMSVGNAPESLLDAWDDGYVAVQRLHNDPDLLPADEVPEKKGSTPTSSKNATTSD